MSIVTQVRTITNDLNGVFWPDQTVYDAVNEAQFAVYAETKWAITSATMTSGTSTLGLGSNTDIFTWPSTVLIPKWIEGTNQLFTPPVVQRFFPTTQRQLEQFLRTWKGQNLGQPMYFCIWDAIHFRVFPRPDNLGPATDGAYPFTLYGIGFPTEIADNIADITGPATYVQSIRNYAASLLFESTRPDLADMYMSQAEDQILAFKKRLRNAQSHNIRQLKPASGRLEINQGGDIYQLPVYYPLES